MIKEHWKLGDSPCSRKRLLSFNDQPPASFNPSASPVVSPHRPPRRVDNNHGGSLREGQPPAAAAINSNSSSSNNNSTATAAVAALATTTAASSTSAFHTPVKQTNKQNIQIFWLISFYIENKSLFYCIIIYYLLEKFRFLGLSYFF